MRRDHKPMIRRKRLDFCRHFETWLLISRCEAHDRAVLIRALPPALVLVRECIIFHLDQKSGLARVSAYVPVFAGRDGGARRSPAEADAACWGYMELVKAREDP